MGTVTAFATAEALAARWRPLDPDEAQLATGLLTDASTMIRRLARNIDDRITRDPTLGDAASIVACAMVRRAMSNPTVDITTNQVASTFGPITQSATIGDRNLYLTRAEREMLGIRKRAWAIDTLGKWTEPQ